MVKKSTVIGLSLVAALTTAALVPSVHAEPPAKPGESSQGAPGGLSSTSVTHSGVLTITEDMATDGQTYASTGDAENAILMTGGIVTLTNPTITKTGSDDGDNADFYGTNAAVFVSGGTLNVTGGSLTTDGGHANGFFAYGEGILNVSNTTIKTTGNNSGAVMVTGGGTLVATYVTAETDGNSSAPIRSDRGGGTMDIKGGSYKSNGVGSPVVYSTADATVEDATLESTASEGVVIEGKNSVTLENTKLIANNTQLNGKSETYKGIFIYQSMSGDADEGVGSFTAIDSNITTKNGDTFFVTNTAAEIELTNTTFTNESGDFLRVQAGGWGESGSNGGQVMLDATDQEIRGNIVLDNISSVSMGLYKDSYYRGVINGENTAEQASVHLDADAVMVLEGDSYLSVLDNTDSENKNIYGNGHKLYVAGEEVATNSETPPSGRKNAAASETSAEATEETKMVDDYSTLGFILAAVGSFLILVIGGILIAKCVKKPVKKDEAGAIAPDGEQKTDAPASETNAGGQIEGPDAR